MESRHRLLPATIAFAAGVILWSAVQVLSGKREAWDSSAYWLIAYPLAIALSGFLGYRFPRTPWLWALLVFESQFMALCFLGGEVGSLWPLGLLLFAVISVPAVSLANFAARRSPADVG